MTESHITIDQVLAWEPCDSKPGERYSREGMLALSGGRTSMTALEVCDLPISASDRLWVLLRPEVLPERMLHLLACDFAERVQSPDADPRSLDGGGSGLR